MKNLFIKLMIMVVGLAFSSCNHNRMKVNEKELANEIVFQEKEKSEAERIAREKELANALNKDSTGPMYKEHRSVDPVTPPLIIDIAGSLNNLKEIKLSDLFSEIKYIRIESPPDSTFRRDIRFRYQVTDDYIIALNTFGMLCYSKDGWYLSTIVKNKFTGIEVTPTGVRARIDMLSFIGDYGSWPIGSYGNKIYYNYLNTLTSQEYRMEYDCAETGINQTIEYDPEDPLKVIGKGKIMADYNKNGTRTKVPNSLSTFWIDDNTYMNKLRGKDALAIISKQGDTLSKFPLYEKLVNYSKSLQRGVDGDYTFEYSGNTYFRNAYNDTIFMVIPPNRLLPVYILNLGSYKVTKQAGG